MRSSTREEVGRSCDHSVFMVIEFASRHVCKNDVDAIQGAHHHQGDYDERATTSGEKLCFHDVVCDE